MSLQVAFLGTPEFAVPSLEAIRRAGHEVVLTVTQPDRPRGRGKRVAETAVKVAAACAGIPVYQPEVVGSPESLARLRSLYPDVLAVVAYGQKLPRALLELPRLGAFNLHASLLPRWRGAAPIAYALWKGDAETGLTIFRMAEKMDAGDIGLQRRVPLGPEETAGELHDRLARLGGELFVEFLDQLSAGRIVFTPQDEARVTFAPSLKKSQGLVDWSQSAAAIHRFVRAMTPWPGATCCRRLPSGAAEALILVKVLPVDGPAQAGPGTVVEIARTHFTIAAGEGRVRVLRLLPSGKRAMDAAEFLRGHLLSPGEILR
ncbi:MAG: methionyl-tRNA formyltransferase [Planctomycetes bacterium]|nr:methionyl-tRNA formyltransferase [Planctomycetota bacterium]